MSIDINFYKEAYFTFDKPVPYKLKCGEEITINPISLSDSMLFMTSYGILDIDKNSTNDAEIISMPYLKFLVQRVLPFSDLPKQQLINICLLCLDFEYPQIIVDDKGKVFLGDFFKNTKEEKFRISQKEFDEIRRIILYQNLPNYDDDYIYDLCHPGSVPAAESEMDLDQVLEMASQTQPAQIQKTKSIDLEL